MLGEYRIYYEKYVKEEYKGQYSPFQIYDVFISKEELVKGYKRLKSNVLVDKINSCHYFVKTDKGYVPCIYISLYNLEEVSNNFE